MTSLGRDIGADLLAHGVSLRSGVGAASGIRTLDLSFTKALLYH
jgi:hypothetical protein